MWNEYNFYVVKDFSHNNIIFINEEAIKKGYPYEYTYGTPYRYASDFKFAETFAKQKYEGLWSPETCNGVKSPVAPQNDNKTNTINPYKNN